MQSKWRDKGHKQSPENLAHESGLARSFTGAIEHGEKNLRLTMGGKAGEYV
jgi:hypothetical protein